MYAHECVGNRAARPLLSVPHILADESAAYYHGYVLAEMSVHQTREHFLQKYVRLNQYLTELLSLSSTLSFTYSSLSLPRNRSVTYSFSHELTHAGMDSLLTTH